RAAALTEAEEKARVEAEAKARATAAEARAKANEVIPWLRGLGFPRRRISGGGGAVREHPRRPARAARAGRAVLLPSQAPDPRRPAWRARSGDGDVTRAAVGWAASESVRTRNAAIRTFPDTA